ncbi:anti-repressor SinI family protein [Bacillus infantis]|uniref:DNA-binding anti-repressor SinI n=1 Tax=Bacillus infantis TaxID=324767 RepID=A0A5D4RB02_9BACI|nr:anti-repressor SinI family protein [Bacillus infantis]TYS47739.1 DNA-binding anti-repressor SinI [Bacillus infantis]
MKKDEKTLSYEQDLYEWICLMEEARKLGMTAEEVREFFQAAKNLNLH